MLEFLKRPEARGLDLESAETTRIHGKLIREKPFLRKLYERYYAAFEACDAEAPPGVRVEIGSGGGFLSERIPGLVTVDVRPGARVDLVASAMALPLASGSAGAVFMLNVLHHLRDVREFFAELERVLVPGGRCVMTEPYVSSFSRVLYGGFHHEPFEPGQEGWELPAESAMSDANDALPWIVFERDREAFEERFPRLRIRRVRPHTVVSYVLSGGLSYRSMAPSALFGLIARCEDFVCSRTRRLATMMTVELEREP